MQNNNNVPGQVPDQRFHELQEQLRRSTEENQRLRGMVDQIAMQQQQIMQRQPQQQQPQSQFTPEIDQALDSKFKQMFQPHFETFRQTIGGLADQNDMLQFQVKYGGEAIEKYGDKIERLRQDRGRQGQYISREDAYRQLYFDEHNRKPKENPVANTQAPAPQFDPYTGMMINPLTPAPQPQQQQAAPVQQQQTPVQQQPGFNANQQQQQAAPVQQQQQQQTVAPNLPPANMNPIGSIPVQPTPGSQQLDIGSGSEVLDSWAAKHGNLTI